MVGRKRRFKVGSCLGRGGFSEVYRATYLVGDIEQHDVAIKGLRDDIDPSGQGSQRLRDEARWMMYLEHPAILRVYDLVELDGCLTLVTEYVEGEDLSVSFKSAQPPGLRTLLEILAQIAAALDVGFNTMGSDGMPIRLVHRDIKPSNIRTSRKGDVKLLDFGLARADTMEREADTNTNLMVGSPSYMAPERFLVDTDVSGHIRAAGDVFSLGCVLYEGLAKSRFYQSIPVPALALMAMDRANFVRHRDQKLHRVLGRAADGVVALLISMLEHSPDRRPTAAEVAERCETLAAMVEGPSLAEWVASRNWPVAAIVQGPLHGKTLLETAQSGKFTVTDTPPPALSMPSPSLSTPSGARPRPARHPVMSDATEAFYALPTDAPEPALEHRDPAPAEPQVRRPARPERSLIESRSAIRAAEQKVATNEPRVVGKKSPVPPKVILGVTVGFVAIAIAALFLPVMKSAFERPEPVKVDPTPEPVLPVVIDPRVEDTAVPTPSTPPVRTEDTAEPIVPPKEVVPPPAPPTPGLVQVEFQPSGQVSVTLLGAGKRHPVPGEVAPGEYDVMASFKGGDVQSVGRMKVSEDHPAILLCSEQMKSCTWR